MFPDSLKFYHSFLLKACGEGHFDSVFHLVQFLQKLYPDFINMHEAHTLNTALHVACRHNNMVEFLVFCSLNFRITVVVLFHFEECCSILFGQWCSC